MNIEPGFIGAGFAIVSACATLVWKASATLAKNDRVLESMDEKLRDLEPLSRQFVAFEVRVGALENVSNRLASDVRELSESRAASEAVKRHSRTNE